MPEMARSAPPITPSWCRDVIRPHCASMSSVVLLTMQGRALRSMATITADSSWLPMPVTPSFVRRGRRSSGVLRGTASTAVIFRLRKSRAALCDIECRVGVAASSAPAAIVPRVMKSLVVVRNLSSELQVNPGMTRAGAAPAKP